MSEVLAFADVRCGYVEGAWAVDGVCFGLAAGEVVGLVGRNGAGKFTLMRLALGMLAPAAGQVAVFGRDPLADPVAVKSRLGYVAEDQILPPFLRLEDAVRQHRELFPAWDAGLERELRERFALDGRARIGSLSKGQARQVALLCAVCRRPELLLLDEPAGGLDPVARREFLETAIRLLNDAGTAILFSCATSRTWSAWRGAWCCCTAGACASTPTWTSCARGARWPSCRSTALRAPRRRRAGTAACRRGGGRTACTCCCAARRRPRAPGWRRRRGSAARTAPPWGSRSCSWS
jgi:ABC-type Na+ transport system ATPase subunit NatA